MLSALPAVVHASAGQRLEEGTDGYILSHEKIVIGKQTESFEEQDSELSPVGSSPMESAHAQRVSIAEPSRSPELHGAGQVNSSFMSREGELQGGSPGGRDTSSVPRRSFFININEEEVTVAKRASESFTVTTSFHVSTVEMMDLIQEGLRAALGVRKYSNKRKRTRHEQTKRNRIVKFEFHEYQANNFYLLRKIAGVASQDLINSLCEEELSGGATNAAGKSGSIFWFSHDHRFVLKSVSASEAANLMSICTAYRKHLLGNPHSLLVRFFGLFKIVVGHSVVFLTLMNNVLPSTETTKRAHLVYDLKGTTEARFVARTAGSCGNEPQPVLKDLNFGDQQIRLPPVTADAMKLQLLEDTLFLKKLGIMDYSLLVGVVRPLLNGAPEIPHVVASLVKHLDRLSSPAEEPPSSASAFLTPSSIRGDGNGKDRRGRGILKQVGEKVASLPRQLKSVFKLPRGGSSDRKAGGGRRKSTAIDVQTSRFESCEGGMAGLSPTGEAEAVLYFVGIIDILTVYDWKKRAAHFFKKLTIGCCHEIDTEPPPVYQPRFVKYFQEKIQPATTDHLLTAVRHAAAVRIQRFLRARSAIQPPN